MSSTVVMVARQSARRICTPHVEGQWLRGYAAGPKVLPIDLLDDDLSLPPKPRILALSQSRMPKRRWMSVTDLVREVEMALITKSASMVEGGRTYNNLQEEATRLRAENDRIAENIAELKAIRIQHVKSEEEATRKFYSSGDFALHKVEMVEAVKKIEEIDCELAGLRYQHKANFFDVGLVKRTMTRIEKRAAVTKLVNKIQAALLLGDELAEDSLEIQDLSELVQGMDSEYDDIVAKVEVYKEKVKEFRARLDIAHAACVNLRETPGQEADNAREELIKHLHEANRMNTQMTRLRDIQLLDSQEIALLERVRRDWSRQRRIHRLLKEGTADEIRQELNVLQQDTSQLLLEMQRMEAALDVSDKEISRYTTRLRQLRLIVTAETGELREKLIACVHEEQQCLGRLAVLRGIKQQKILWLAKLKSALPE